MTEVLHQNCPINVKIRTINHVPLTPNSPLFLSITKKTKKILYEEMRALNYREVDVVSTVVKGRDLLPGLVFPDWIDSSSLPSEK